MSGLLYEVKGGVARLTLNRPEVHNAFDDALISLLDETLLRAADDPAVRLLMLGANGKSFSAGADLNWMRKAADYSDEENLADAMTLGRMLERLYRMPKPTVALIDGAVFGGGVGLVAACDIALATERAKFSLSEVRLGLIPAVISPYVVGAIGARQARRYFQTAERFDVQQAQQMGLVHQVVEDLQAAGEALAGHLLQCGQQAQAAAKSLIDAVDGRPIDDALIADTARRIVEARSGDEGREGLTAFLEKRSPSWRGEGH